MHTFQIDGSALASTEEEALALAAEAEINAEAQTMWWDDKWRAAQAATISTTIYEGFRHENLLPILADVRNVQRGDIIRVEDVRGLDVFWTSHGGRIDESTIFDRAWNLRPDRLGYHVTELNEKMQSGFARSSQLLVNLAVQQMDAAINKRLFGLYQAAIPGSSSPYYVSGAGLSLPALDTGIVEVKDDAITDDVAIIGRSTMTQQIITQLEDKAGFTPTTNEEMLQGILGRYRGCPIISLKNYRDSRGRSIIPGNELIVAAKGAATVGFWGGLTTQEWSEQGGFYWHNFGYRDVGMALSKKSWVRRYVDTSRNP